jgi:predicted dehydrogenase
VEPRGQPDHVRVVGQAGQFVDGVEHLGQVSLVVVRPVVLGIPGQQVLTERLGVRQQAVPPVTQLHGRESGTRGRPGRADPAVRARVVAKAISARHTEVTMRFGLVGTGPWARATHGPGLHAADGVELVGVWGRDPDKSRRVSTELGVSAYADYSELLAEVEAVAFAVPPRIQAALAREAAGAGRHLLLDKPVADSEADARALADAVSTAGVASVVFFTGRFTPASRAWYAEMTATGGWRGGWSRMLAALDAPGNPFAASPWRRERGALWDIGPHALSNLSAVLGPIEQLTAVGGQGDLVHLVLTHQSGVTSTASLSLFAPPAGSDFETGLWGESGTALMPSDATAGAEALAIAATELVAAARSGEPHPVGLGFGVRVVELLADAERQLSAER